MTHTLLVHGTYCETVLYFAGKHSESHGKHHGSHGSLYLNLSYHLCRASHVLYSSPSDLAYNPDSCPYPIEGPAGSKELYSHDLNPNEYLMNWAIWIASSSLGSLGLGIGYISLFRSIPETTVSTHAGLVHPFFPNCPNLTCQSNQPILLLIPKERMLCQHRIVT